jgi:hypothetical protein
MKFLTLIVILLFLGCSNTKVDEPVKVIPKEPTVIEVMEVKEPTVIEVMEVKEPTVIEVMEVKEPTLLAPETTVEALPFVPVNFLMHRPLLVKTMVSEWPEISIPSSIAGLIEQETCYSLIHSRCWSVYAKLETEREYGFGLGQLTVTKRFNAFEEAKLLNIKLKSWKWEDRLNPEFQMIAILSMMRRNYNAYNFSETELDRFAFSLASYNGGLGGIQADQRICRNTPKCNPNLWFNNTENTSLKQKVVVTGYGKSFFQINREYPVNILMKRRFKYKPYLDEHFKKAIL